MQRLARGSGGKLDLDRKLNKQILIHLAEVEDRGAFFKAMPFHGESLRNPCHSRPSAPIEREGKGI
jgi:hypothetical protein